MKLFRNVQNPRQMSLFPNWRDRVVNFIYGQLITLGIIALIIFVGCQAVILIIILRNRLDSIFEAYGRFTYMYERLHLFSILWLSIAALPHLVLKRLSPRNQITWLKELLSLIKWAALTIFCVDIFTNLLVALENPIRVNLALLFYLLGLTLYLAFWKLPKIHLSRWSGRLELKDRLALENSVRATFIQIIGGVLVLMGLYFTVQNLGVSQENVRISLEKTQKEQLIQAAKQLQEGDHNVRLISVRELKNLAGTSWDNYKSIREIFNEHVRAQATWIGDQANVNKAPAASQKYLREILSFLGTKPPLLRGSGGEVLAPINLSGADLRGVDFTKAFWPAVILSSARLEGSHFNEAILSNANLSSANLEHVDFRGAVLDGANFYNANLKNTILHGASIENAELSKALNLTKEQISSARGRAASLPPNVQDEINQTTKPAPRQVVP